MTIDPSPEALQALADELHETGSCPYCNRDPYHYVDNGVGMERVAVVCCEAGIEWFQYGRETDEPKTLEYEAAAILRALAERAAPAPAGDLLKIVFEKVNGEPWDELAEAQKIYREAMQDIISTIRAAGYAVVPREPTPRMVKAACMALSPERRPREWLSVKEKHRYRYRAMIAAGEAGHE